MSCRATAVILLLLLAVLSFPPTLRAQAAVTVPVDATTTVTAGSSSVLNSRTDVPQLVELSDRLTRQMANRDALALRLQGVDSSVMTDEREQLEQLNADIKSLRSAFEFAVLEAIDTRVLEDTPVEDRTWQQELVDILSPLMDSLRTLTERPRKLSEMRAQRLVLEQKLQVTQQALAEIEAADQAVLDIAASRRLVGLREKWTTDSREFEQALARISRELELHAGSSDTALTKLGVAFRTFLRGSGLTLLLALSAAFLAWAISRSLWWVMNRYVFTREQRRRSTWYRLVSYSYFIVTMVLVLVAVLVALYLREDILLLGLSVLLLVSGMLRLRNTIPKYVNEARLLLNLGDIREEESVIYEGLPWIVRSVNLYSVLHNPELNGIVRLPLETMSQLVSRPIKSYKDTVWFPTSRGDYVLLADERFGQVIRQTPELVEVSVRGGMLQTFPADTFYRMNIVNLSRNETFGVSVVFGFDYAEQALALDNVPAAIRRQVIEDLERGGYAPQVKDILVDFSAAASSSLDYIVFLTVEASLASQYFALQRLVQKACIKVSNDNGWSIPFPQLTVHAGTEDAAAGVEILAKT